MYCYAQLFSKRSRWSDIFPPQLTFCRYDIFTWQQHSITSSRAAPFWFRFNVLLLSFSSERHIFLQPISSREEAAGCVITWLISCHATNREREWDRGSVIRWDGGALPRQTSESTWLVSFAAAAIYLRVEPPLSISLSLSQTTRHIVSTVCQNTLGIKPQTYPSGECLLTSTQLRVAECAV